MCLNKILPIYQCHWYKSMLNILFTLIYSRSLFASSHPFRVCLPKLSFIARLSCIAALHAHYKRVILTFCMRNTRTHKKIHACEFASKFSSDEWLLSFTETRWRGYFKGRFRHETVPLYVDLQFYPECFKTFFLVLKRCLRWHVAVM